MSQNIFADINPAVTSGTQLATYLNQFKAALMSGLSGVSRPTELLAGGMWLDTSEEDAPDFLWHLKIYDGTSDRTLLTLNLSTGGVIISGSEDEFAIQHISADAVGPLLTFIKQRIASSGQVLAGDVLGEIDYFGRGDDSSDPLAALIKVVAGQNMTATESSAYFDFEGTPHNSVVRSVFARLRNSSLAVGAGFDPENTIHARGTTGIKSERVQDDANGAQVVMRKKRITGSGATQNNDVIGTVNANTTDDASAEATSAQIQAVATEAHTSSAQGTKWLFKVINAGAAALSSAFEIGSQIISYVDLKLNKKLSLVEQVDSSTTGSGQSISPTNSIIKVTNASLTSINNIANPADGNIVLLINGTGGNLTIVNDSGGTAANRIKTGTGADVTLDPNTSVLLCYDANSSRWQIVGGTGAGGGGGSMPVKWIEQGNSPQPDVENFTEIYKYMAGESQNLYALIRVSDKYSVGRQIKLKMCFYSGDSSGDILPQTLATLVRKEVDAMSSTTNQRTSTNSAVTLGAGTVNEPQEVTFDLTDSAGAINSVAVGRGDLIIVKLTRGSDTATGDLKALVQGAEVLLT